MSRSLADLRLDERRVRALELWRVQHGACHPVRGLRRSRPLAEQRRPVGGIGVHTVITARRRRGEDKSPDPVRMIDDQVLRDEAAHRCAEHRRRSDLGGIEDGHGVTRHVRQRDSATVPDSPMPRGSKVITRYHRLSSSTTGSKTELRAPSPGMSRNGSPSPAPNTASVDAVAGGRGHTLQGA